MSNGKLKTQISLCLMMFMQYLLLAVWWVPYVAYLTNAGISGNLKALIMSSMAIGFMASSVMGAFADRYFPAQKVLSFSNFVVAGLLACTGLTHNTTLAVILIFPIMLLHMPTWSLTGAIVLKHVQPEHFPRIRLFGTLGWVASGLFSLVFIKVFHVTVFDGGTLPFLCGSGVALIASVLNLTLPNTPPGGEKDKISVSELLGFKAFTMFRDRNFLVFTLCAFAAVLAYSLYYTFGAEFLQDRRFEYITITLNWGQVGELFFLFITTILITRFGFKKAMIIGLAAMLARYLSFWWGSVSDTPAFYIVGILFHGVIFGLFFVTGQIYTDKKASDALRAQAQGLLAFLLWGVGLLVGNFICSNLIDANTTIDAAGHTIYNWSVIFGVTSGFSLIVLLLFVVFYKNENG
ncbi:MAG: MFS transporter [Dysgonamonadaceae bacterium]|jgi:nucleoside transporter|nr:MFS transporter [Dysgonamonadaceae bacterium]